MRKRSRLKYLFAILFIAGFIGGLVVLGRSGGPSLNLGTIQEEKKEVEYYDCFVLAGSFYNLDTGFSLQELSGRALKTTIGGLEQLDLNDENKTVLTLSVLQDKTPYEIIKENKNELVLVSPDDLDPRLKNFTVDGISFWDFENIENYPLCSLKKTTYLNQGEYDEFVHSLFEYQGKYYTFDPDSAGSIYSAGETIPARAVDRTWLDQTDNYTLLYDRYADVIKNSTLSLIMLENPVSGDPTPCKGCMQFIGDERNVAALKEIGFDAAGVGNHFGDGGRNALENTIQAFSKSGLLLAGASSTGEAEASKPVYMDMNGKRVAFFSADDVAAYYWAGTASTSWGTNRYSSKSSSGGVGAVDHVKVQKDIGEARQNADIVIVMLSSGVEYTNKASTHQVELAHALIDAGADIIVGSHPHWVQQVDFYKGRPIFYSLGNYIFDQTNDGPDADWSRFKGETRQGISVQMHFLGADLKAIDIIPHKMCGYDQAPGGESANKTHNLAWKIQSGEMSYAEVDAMSESEGCVWYQPTPVRQGQAFYNDIWNRLLEYSSI
ncbi:CapA family protein [Candidatus Dojkabacteria bacterium]|nr:CapA family protein [Candidatus Dojkabacteria bacterium]